MENKFIAVRSDGEKIYDLTNLIEFIEQEYDGKIKDLVDDLEKMNIQYLTGVKKVEKEEKKANFEKLDKLRKAIRTIKYRSINSYWSSVEY